MKNILKDCIFIMLICFFHQSVQASIFYVDYDGGNDINDGLSENTAWKHSPGDTQAILNPLSVILVAGDTILFKGGVNYRGTITMKYSGVEDAQINYKGDGWGAEKAIIDGSEKLSVDWYVCISAAEAGENPNWQNIFYTTYSGDISPFNQMFEKGERAYIAQTPNMTDPFWDDRITEYLTVIPENITRTSLRDDVFFDQASTDYWNGAYIQIWVQPNVISIQKINSYDPDLHSVFYDSLSNTAIYGDKDQFYCIVNHLSAIDRPGEYVVDELNKTIYYWPYGDIEDCEFSISARSYGIETNGCSHICIEGFKIQGNTNDNAAYAIWNNRTWGDPSFDISVKNNEITNTRTKNGRKGSISFSNINGVTIENNYIHECQRNSAIVISAVNGIIRNNQIKRIGYKGIWSMGSKDLQILNNSIVECEGTHGNPVSIFTTENSLIANNFLKSKGEVFTFEKDTVMVVHNNIMMGELVNGAETGTNIIRQNGSTNSYCFGYMIITNNTLQNSITNSGIGITEYFENLGNVIIKNNITDGGPGREFSMSMSRSYNIYTGLGWSQDERYGWVLGDGEFVETDLDALFVNPLEEDFQLKKNSSARNVGLDPEIIIPDTVKTIFPDFDFDLDFSGNLRGIDGLYDIGAVEYQDPIVPANVTIANQTFPGDAPICFGATDSITIAGNGSVVTFENGSNLSLIAGKSIRLLPGTTIQTGAYVHASITTDGTFCGQSATPVVNNIIDEKAYEIDGSYEADEKGMDEKFVKIYPNPSNGRFTIELSNFQSPVKVSIINMLGSTIYPMGATNSTHCEIDLSAFLKGVYIVRIADNESVFSKKICIQ